MDDGGTLKELFSCARISRQHLKAEVSMIVFLFLDLGCGCRVLYLKLPVQCVRLLDSARLRGEFESNIKNAYIFRLGLLYCESKTKCSRPNCPRGPSSQVSSSLILFVSNPALVVTQVTLN